MSNDKKQTAIRIVGFIALTILVIVGVILTIYFVQKAEDNSKIEYINGQIGTRMELGDSYFTVTDVCSNFKFSCK